MDWTHDPGRIFGCFEARPEVSYESYVERSLDKIKAEFDQHRQEWDSSEAKVELMEHMDLITKHHHLANVVSFGTGSFQSDHLPTRRHNHFQVAALLTMTEYIGKEAMSHKVLRYTKVTSRQEEIY